jgi:hypothetical protein
VHAGRPADDAAEALHSLNANWSIGGYTPALRQLQAIGRVVLRGLGELRERMQRMTLVTTLLSLVIPALGQNDASQYELVILDGRVMDPESGLDAVRHLGIGAGKIQVLRPTRCADGP